MRLFSLRWLLHSYQDSTTGSFSGETSASVVQRLSMLGPGLLNCISLESPTESQLSPVAHWGVGSNLSLVFSPGKASSIRCSACGIGRTGSSQQNPSKSLHLACRLLQQLCLTWEVNAWN